MLALLALCVPSLAGVLKLADIHLHLHNVVGLVRGYITKER